MVSRCSGVVQLSVLKLVPWTAINMSNRIDNMATQQNWQWLSLIIALFEEWLTKGPGPTPLESISTFCLFSEMRYKYE